MADPSSMSDPREAAWRTATVLMFSLPTGVTLLAVVGWWLNMTQPRVAPLDTGPLSLAWLVLTVGTTMAATVVWRRMVRPLVPPSGFRADAPAPGEVGRLQTGLVVCMALVEGAALFGGVLLILGAGPVPALVGVIMAWTASFLLRPRRGWYGLR